MSESENKETGKLGFGLMRLQRKVFSTDIPKTKKWQSSSSIQVLNVPEQAVSTIIYYILLWDLITTDMRSLESVN